MMAGLYVVFGVGCRHVVASAADPAVFVPLLATLASAGRVGFGVAPESEVDTVQGCCDHCTLTVAPPAEQPATPACRYDRDPIGTVRRCPITGDLYTRVSDGEDRDWVAVHVHTAAMIVLDPTARFDAVDSLATSELPRRLDLLELAAVPVPGPVVELDLGDAIEAIAEKWRTSDEQLAAAS